MKIVVVGDGKVGSTLTRQLSGEGHDVILIDNREQILNESINSLDVMGICGNGVNYNVQLEADVPHADILIAVANADEVNMLCCLVAKKLGAKNTIARIRNPEYSDQLHFWREDLGLSMTINPEQAAADEIFKVLRYPAAIRIDLFARGALELVELRVSINGVLDGLPLSSISKKCGAKILVCAVRRGEEVIIPNGDFILQAKDMISIAALTKDMERFWKSVGSSRSRLHRVIIVGGGHVSHYLSKRLIEANIEVKVVEIDPARCRQLSSWLPQANIIEGNGTNHELLLEEGLDGCNAFVALTGMDEENIILSLYALTRNIPKVITKVNNSSLIDLVGNVGLDTFISPKDITADHIVSYVRAMQNTMGSNVETLYKIAGGLAEALEFYVKPNSHVINIPLKDISLKPSILIASIVRKGKVFVPTGTDTIHIKDKVIIITTNRCFNDLDDILA